MVWFQILFLVIVEDLYSFVICIKLLHSITKSRLSQTCHSLKLLSFWVSAALELKKNELSLRSDFWVPLIFFFAITKRGQYRKAKIKKLSLSWISLKVWVRSRQFWASDSRVLKWAEKKTGKNSVFESLSRDFSINNQLKVIFYKFYLYFNSWFDNTFISNTWKSYFQQLTVLT